MSLSLIYRGNCISLTARSFDVNCPFHHRVLLQCHKLLLIQIGFYMIFPPSLSPSLTLLTPPTLSLSSLLRSNIVVFSTTSVTSIIIGRLYVSARPFREDKVARVTTLRVEASSVKRTGSADATTNMLATQIVCIKNSIVNSSRKWRDGKKYYHQMQKGSFP